MFPRAFIALLLLLSACATTNPEGVAVPNPRITNLQRAAQWPWTDEGRCAVREASQEWPVLAERCYPVLDRERVEFHDLTGKCSVASAGAAALGMGLCVFAAPEIVVGAVVVIGVVAIAAVIQEELQAYERNASRQRGKPQAPSSASREAEPIASGEPGPKGLGRDWFPPEPPGLEPRDDRPECTPKRVPPKGGHPLHNQCADNVPLNAFRGCNALVNGKAFDALQWATRTLWEVKTNAIETYNPFIQATELNKQVEEARRERALAQACGYDFVLGVRTETHRQMLKEAAPDITVVLMTWCR